MVLCTVLIFGLAYITSSEKDEDGHWQFQMSSEKAELTKEDVGKFQRERVITRSLSLLFKYWHNRDAIVPCSQSIPSYPGLQKQVKLLMASKHVPCTHGELAHSSKSSK